MKMKVLEHKYSKDILSLFWVMQMLEIPEWELNSLIHFTSNSILKVNSCLIQINHL